MCQAISANTSGSNVSDSDLLCHKQFKKCNSDFKFDSVQTMYDNTDGVIKSSVFMTAVSASQLETIVTRIKSLVLSESLPELDTILSELNQVNCTGLYCPTMMNNVGWKVQNRT